MGEAKVIRIKPAVEKGEATQPGKAKVIQLKPAESSSDAPKKGE